MTAAALLLRIVLSAHRYIRCTALQFPPDGRAVNAELSGDLGAGVTHLIERFDLVP
nr:hypothetical protein [Deinococcus sp.]